MSLVFNDVFLFFCILLLTSGQCLAADRCARELARIRWLFIPELTLYLNGLLVILAEIYRNAF